MTKRERVLAALSHQQTDFAPYQVEFTQQARERVEQYVRNPEFFDNIGNHVDGAYFDGYFIEEKPGYFRDGFGVLWNRTGADKDIGVIEGCCIPEPDMSLYTFPPFDEKKLRAELEALLARKNDCFKTFSIGFSMYERAWTLRGMENFLMDMAVEEDFADELLDAICEYNLQVIRIALSYDIDGFYFGDDWGQQKGLIMGAPHWRRFIKPRMARMFAEVKKAGKPVFLHSCGDIQELFPDLIEMGLDCYQTFQPEIYDVAAVKKEYGDRLSFWGGVSTQRLLPYASPEEIKRTVKELIQVVGKNGGYIVAPTHGIPGDVPPKNIVAMIEAMQQQ